MYFLLYTTVLILILVVSLGWGNVFALTAVVIVSLAIAGIFSPYSSVIILFTLLLPTAFIGHLSSLPRPANEIGGPEKLIAWYPLADIMTHLCGLLAVISTFIASVILTDSKKSTLLTLTATELLHDQYPGKILEAADIERLKMH